MKKNFSALLGLTLVLAACGQSNVGTPGGNGGGNGGPLDVGGNGSFTVSGNVRFKAALPNASAGQGVQAQALTPQAALASANWSANHVPGAVLVQANLTALSAQSARVLSGLRTQSVGDDLTLVTTTPGAEQALAERLAAAGYVVQPNYVYRLAAIPPNDPGYPNSDPNSGITVNGAKYDQDYLTRINVEDAWRFLSSKNVSLAGVKVAVLDTGVNANHPELKGHVLAGQNFSVSPSNGDTSDAAGNVHGTSTAGIIGASTDNGVGIAGVTWGGPILPVKVFDASGNATTVSLTGGVNYAVQQGARVINMSLGFTGNNDDPKLSAAIANAKSKGSVVVAAAGNTPNEGLYYPASDPNVIAVGAFGKSDAPACYSARPNPGQRSIDLYAPGGPGPNCEGGNDYNILSLGPNNGYQLIAGTSEATPQVSGAVSLMLAANPKLTVDQVRSILTSTAKDFGGNKLLNVGAAVRKAASTGTGTTPPPTTTPQTYKVDLYVYQGSNPNPIAHGDDTVQSGATAMPYQAGLAAGSYTLKATVSLNGQVVQQGSRTVNVSGNLSGQDIQTQ